MTSPTASAGQIIRLLLLLMMLQLTTMLSATPSPTVPHSPGRRPLYGGRYSTLSCLEVNPKRMHLSVVFPCDWPDCPHQVVFQYKDVAGNRETSIVSDSEMNSYEVVFEDWHDMQPDTEYHVRAVPPPNTTVSIWGDEAEGVFRSAPARPPPVQDLDAYETGVNFIALRWTPPPSLVGPCPWRMFYGIKFRERADGGNPAEDDGWQRWVYDPDSPRRRPFTTSDAFPCPAAYAGQQCAVASQGLRPDTLYEVEVQVFDSFSISSSEIRSLIVKTDAGPPPARMQRPPRFVAATDTTLTFAVDVDCEPYCSGYSAAWQLRNEGAQLWEQHGEAVVWLNFTFTHLGRGRAYQARALLKRMGEPEAFAADDIPFANASTCARVSMPVRHLELSGNATSPVKLRWTVPRGSCAYTRYVIQRYSYEKNSSDAIPSCPPTNLKEPQPKYTCQDRECEARVDDYVGTDTKYKLGVVAINWKEQCSPVTYATLEPSAENYEKGTMLWAIVLLSVILLTCTSLFVTKVRRKKSALVFQSASHCTTRNRNTGAEFADGEMRSDGLLLPDTEMEPPEDSSN